MSTTEKDSNSFQRTEEKVEKKGRKGKKAAQKSQEKYRARRADQDMEEFDKALAAKYKLFSSDQGSLKKALETVKIVKAKVAVPLSTSTRGIGVATAMAYSRTCTTWNPREIGRIVSVHQVYRVHLLCAHVKLYKAQQIQTECLSVYGALRRIIVNDQIREMMETVGQPPSAMMAVMDAIGRIEVDDRIYHMGYAEIPAIADIQEQAETAALTLCPDTIQGTLLLASDAETPIEWRQEFEAMCSIPGAVFRNHVLQNAADIWPDGYGELQIFEDLHAFKNWVTRVEGRLPSHSFPELTWSGVGTPAGLISCEPVDLRMISTMRTHAVDKVVPRGPGGKRPARLTDQETAQSLEHVTVSSNKTDFWCLVDTKEPADAIGAASLVGEVHCHVMRQAASYPRNHFSY